MTKKSIVILGTEYAFEVREYEEDPCFGNDGIDGYHDGPAKLIVVCDLNTHPGYSKESASHREEMQKEIVRHEIVHAFLYGSGLSVSSGKINVGWAVNEEMVDWFAMQGQKIYKAWQEAGCL